VQRVADLLLRYPRLAFAALAVLSLAAGLYLVTGGVRFDYNLEGFLPAGDPTIQAYRAFTEAYEPDDVFVIVGFETADVYAYETLRDIEAMTAALAALEGVERVISLTSLENIRATEDGVEVAPVVDRLDPDPEALDALRQRLRADSLAVGYVVNPAGDATALLIQIDPALNTFDGRGPIIDAARAAVAPWADRYEFRWSGFPYLRNAYVNALQVEVVRSVGLATLVIVLVLLFLFRSVRGVVLPLVMVWLGLMWTIAVMMLSGSYIDVLTSSTAAIILVVAVADSIHLLAKYQDGLTAGLDKRAAIRQMVVRLGAATLMTSVTTAIGFGTLATSRVVPMQRFGVFTAAGVLLTFALSLVLVTVLLLWTRPPKPETLRRVGGRSRMAEWLRRVDLLAERHPRRIVAVSAVLLVLSLAGASQLRVNSYINDDLGPRTRVYQDIRFFESRIVSPFRFEVLLTTNEEDAFKEPELLAEVERVERYLQAQPFVTRTVSPVDLLKQMNRALRGDSAEAYVLPDSRELAAQYFLLLELTDEDFLRRFADFDYREVRISTHMDDVGSARIQAFRDDFQAFLAETLPPGVTATTTGTIVLAADLSDYLVESLLLSIGLAFLFISLLMGALFRDVKLVLISLVPNVAPLVAIAGIMGAAGIEIKPATAVIFSIAFGIAVDDTIHMLARLRQEVQAGHDLRVALRHTVVGTGKALILTSVILLGGFLVLTTSQFQSTMYMGFLVSATIGLALFADLFLLPALLHLLYPELKRPPIPLAEEPRQGVTGRQNAPTGAA
jgi:uncharacterized protein